jgi:DMSO/TMAO reductase YedYZ molybdopterin-dependent catalytic subunit
MSPPDKNEKDKELPPGQVPIRQLLRWGKNHATISGPVPKIDLKSWVLMVDGEVEKPLKLSWNDFQKLPMVESASDFHCVEGWSVMGCRWEGIKFKHVVDFVKPKKTATSVTFECADGYTTSLRLNELLHDNVLLACKLDGKPLEQGYGFPLRLVVPDKYGYKSAWWVTRIKFTSTKDKGYWERRGYSDTADVWEDDRFSK